MNKTKKMILGSAAIAVAVTGYSETKKKVDLSTLPPIPGIAPAVRPDKKVMIEELLAQIPENYGVFAGEQLKFKDVEPQLRSVLKNPRMAQSPKENIIKTIEDICRSVLEKKALLLLASKDSSYKELTDAEIEKEYQNVVARYKGEANLERMLKRDGLTIDYFKSMVSDNLIIRRYIDAFRDAIPLTDAEIEVEYNNNRARYITQPQVQASHILKKLPKDATDDIKKTVKAEIDAILAKLKQGADFAELAKAESDCPSGAKGGDLGLFTKERMVKPFSAAAFKMEKGEISEVVETQFGYHVIKVTDKKAGGQKTLAEVKDQLSQNIRFRKMNTLMKQTINKCIADNKGEITFKLKNDTALNQAPKQRMIKINPKDINKSEPIKIVPSKAKAVKAAPAEKAEDKKETAK